MLKSNSLPIVPAGASAPSPKPTAQTPSPASAAHPFAELLQQQKTLGAAAPASGAGSHAAPVSRSGTSSGALDATLPPSSTTESHGDRPVAAPQPQRDAPQAKARAGSAAHPASSGTPAEAGLATARAVQGQDHGAAPGSRDDAAAASATAVADPDPATIAPASSVPTHIDARIDTPSAAAAVDPAAAPAGATGGNGLPAGRDVGRLGVGAIAIGRKLGVQPGLDPTARPAPGDTLTSATPQPGPRIEPEQTAQAVMAMAMQPGGPSTPTAASATGNSATVPTPVASPDFPAAFGMQVTALTKDGVQQAQLHLNPAEMGPVSIHIALDGKLAHIDFGADMAATRQAIEASLPALASALRDAGFTLAGGGVAQHSGSDRGGRDEQPSAGSAPAWASADTTTIGAIDGAARRQSQRVAAGGIDLFA